MYFFLILRIQTSISSEHIQTGKAEVKKQQGKPKFMVHFTFYLLETLNFGRKLCC